MNSHYYPQTRLPLSGGRIVAVIAVCIAVIIVLGVASQVLQGGLANVGGVDFTGTSIYSANPPQSTQTMHLHGSGTVTYSITPPPGGDGTVSLNVVMFNANGSFEDTVVALSDQPGSQTGSATYQYTGDASLDISGYGSYTIHVSNASL